MRGREERREEEGENGKYNIQEIYQHKYLGFQIYYIYTGRRMSVIHVYHTIERLSFPSTYKTLNGLHNRIGSLVIVWISAIESVVTDCSLHVLPYLIIL